MEIKRPQSRQPIPPHAKRVFKGVLFDVYQWEQEMFDGNIKTFEKIKRVDTVGILPITAQGKIILSRERQPGTEPFIGCIGGRMDEGEDPLLAAKRELAEEAGIEAREWKLWFSCQPSTKIDWAVYSFIVKDLKRLKIQDLDSGEKIELIEVGFDEFVNKIVTQDNYRDFEIAIRILQEKNDSKKFRELRGLFLD